MTVSILFTQPIYLVQEIVAHLNIEGIIIETGILKSDTDLTKDFKNQRWDMVILDLNDNRINYRNIIESVYTYHARTRLIAVNDILNSEEINSLLSSGIHEYIPTSNTAFLEIKIRQQIEIALLLKRARELEHSLNYKSQFIAKISHEMRTTLNSVILLSEILAENRNQSLKKDEIEYIDLIHGSSNNLLDLLNKILDLSKIQSGKMDIQLEELEIKDFCTRFSRLYIPVAAEKDIEFKYEHCIKKIDSINTDRIRLEQVLNNLISNAIKFTHKGHVKLKVYLADEEELVKRKINHKEKMIAFQISDTGIGINAEREHIIFESYVQADGQSTEKKYGGTGLGLAISKEITQILGGKLSLDSEYGIGSIFTVYLPLDSYDAVQNKPEVEIVKLVKKAKKEHNTISSIKNKNSNGTILLIDNSTIHNMALKEFLSKVVENCITVESAQEAYELLKTEQNFVCIILDMYLPDAYGKDVLQTIRTIENHKHTPVIIYTGKTISKTEQKELYQEAVAVVQKNVNSYKVLLGQLSNIIN